MKKKTTLSQKKFFELEWREIILLSLLRSNAGRLFSLPASFYCQDAVAGDTVMVRFLPSNPTVYRVL